MKYVDIDNAMPHLLKLGAGAEIEVYFKGEIDNLQSLEEYKENETFMNYDIDYIKSLIHELEYYGLDLDNSEKVKDKLIPIEWLEKKSNEFIYDSDNHILDEVMKDWKKRG